MLIKLSCRGRDFPTAVRRARRAVAEFRIRGVSTNIPFLQAVLDDPDFQAGRITTSFIEERPQLLTARSSADRGTKILNYLADVTVNKPHGERPSTVYPHDKLPDIDLSTDPPAGSKQRLTELGPQRFAAWLRESRGVAVTDTTFRDAHQSLLATRVRTSGLIKVAPYLARTMPQLLSVECWGGATYDVALRFLKEDPWERLAALREAMPNICLQMLLRGRNTVGYTPYPETVTTAFVEEATATGIDIFRIFDALNNVDSMRPAIDAVRDTGAAVAEVAMSYTGDLSDPAEKLYTLDYYLKLAEQIVEAGAHVLAIKDMAGLLRAPAAATLVSALKSRFDLPVHVHTHDTRADNSRATRRPGTRGPTPSTVPLPRSRGPPASPRCHRSWPPPPTPTTTPGCRCGRCATWNRTGRRCGRCTRRSNPGCRPRRAASTTTRSPVANCRTCASRPLRWVSATGSRTSKTPTPAPTPSSGTSSRSRRRARWSATWRWRWSGRASARKTSPKIPRAMTSRIR
ncbi:biotin carboxylase C-terminal domain protein [Mycobacterium intracellulare]|nr:biotin carboxylase C-terminal domain protein [Mycobacterium intracellulare]